VFTTRIGTPIDPRNASLAFNSLPKKSGVPQLRFHDLRHSAATLLLVQGLHPRVIMDLSARQHCDDDGHLQSRYPGAATGIGRQDG
jgi:integrase